MLIIGTLSILFIELSAMWIVLPAMVGYIILMDYDAEPRPKIVKRWNKQAGKYIKYEIDEKTGKYIRKVD